MPVADEVEVPRREAGLTILDLRFTILDLRRQCAIQNPKSKIQNRNIDHSADASQAHHRLQALLQSRPATGETNGAQWHNPAATSNPVHDLGVRAAFPTIAEMLRT
jgi:hypothetical protein